jgi:hypothetical protein
MPACRGWSNYPNGEKKTARRKKETDMQNRFFQSCTILVLGLAAIQTAASAQETPGIEGVWFADVTAVDCQTGAVIPNVLPFRGLYMFGHDGSLTNEAAFLVPSPRRSSGLGSWRHTQAQRYTSTFQFFRFNPDGSFMVMRRVTSTIVLNGDEFTSMDTLQDFDANNSPISSMGCNIVTAIRVQ